MTKKIKIFFIVLLLGNSISCGRKPREIQISKKQVKSYLKLIELQGNENPNMSKIKTLYSTTLINVATEGEQIQPGIKMQIENFLKKAEESEEKNPSLQGVQKSFQNVFFLLIQKNLKAISLNNKENENFNHLQKAKIYYLALDNTLEKREKFIQSENIFRNRIKEAFQNIEIGIKQKSQKNIDEGQKTIQDILARTYFLSVLYELKGISENRGVNELKVKEKRIEGLLFFKIIEGLSKSSEIRIKIKNEFNKPVYEINISKLQNYLKIAFPGFSKDYADKFIN